MEDLVRHRRQWTRRSGHRVGILRQRRARVADGDPHPGLCRPGLAVHSIGTPSVATIDALDTVHRKPAAEALSRSPLPQRGQRVRVAQLACIEDQHAVIAPDRRGQAIVGDRQHRAQPPEDALGRGQLFTLRDHRGCPDEHRSGGDEMNAAQREQVVDLAVRALRHRRRRIRGVDLRHERQIALRPRLRDRELESARRIRPLLPGHRPAAPRQRPRSVVRRLGIGRLARARDQATVAYRIQPGQDRWGRPGLRTRHRRIHAHDGLTSGDQSHVAHSSVRVERVPRRVLRRRMDSSEARRRSATAHIR